MGNGPDLFPLGLKLLERLGRLQPIARFGQGLGSHAEGLLLCEVLPELLGLLREVGVAPGPHLVARGLEARPKRLGLVLRSFAGLLPAGVEIAELLRRLLVILALAKGFGSPAELFLDVHVREVLPLGFLAQVFDPREEGLARGLDAAEDRLFVVLRRQRARVLDRGPRLTHRAIGIAQGQALGLDQAFESMGQLREAGSVVPGLLVVDLAHGMTSALEPGLGGLPAVAKVVGSPVGRPLMPLRDERFHRGDRRSQLGRVDGLLGADAQRVELGATGFVGHEGLVAAGCAYGRFFEPTSEGIALGPGPSG